MWDMDDVMSLVHNGINVVGIGYTVYLGSEHEHEMLTEAATFIRQAHELGMLAVVWMYPRGQAVADEKDPQLIAGAAGVAACIGADFAKVNYPRAFEGMTAPESLGIAVEAAGRTGIIALVEAPCRPRNSSSACTTRFTCPDAAARHGSKHPPEGTEEAVRMAAACHAIICEGASVDEALALYQG